MFDGLMVEIATRSETLVVDTKTVAVAADFAQTVAAPGTMTARTQFVSPAVTLPRTPRLATAGKATRAGAVSASPTPAMLAITGTSKLALNPALMARSPRRPMINAVKFRANIAPGRATNVSVSLKTVQASFTCPGCLAAVRATPPAAGAPAVSATAADAAPVTITATAG